MMDDKQTVEPATSEHAQGTHAVAGGPVLIHIWEIDDPDHADVVVQRIDAMLTQVSREPGCVSARVLESDDRRSIATAIEMRTSEDRQHIEQLPIVGQTLAHMDGTVNVIVRRYHERESF
jgi:hypothetical protein